MKKLLVYKYTLITTVIGSKNYFKYKMEDQWKSY